MVANPRETRSQTRDSQAGTVAMPSTQRVDDASGPSLRKNTRTTTLEDLIGAEGRAEELPSNEGSDDELEQSLGVLRKRRDTLKARASKRKLLEEIAQYEEEERLRADVGPRDIQEDSEEEFVEFPTLGCPTKQARRRSTS